MKKFSILENFNYTDEDIEDFFFEYYEKKKFSLSHGFINSNNRFFTEISDVDNKSKECKKAEISIDVSADGIIDYNGPSLTNIDAVSEALSVIKRFYARSKEDINFKINQNYKGLSIIFFIVGPLVNDSHINTKDEMNSLLEELIPIMTGWKYGDGATLNPKLKASNWLEIKTRKGGIRSYGGYDNWLRGIMLKAMNGQLVIGNIPGNSELRVKRYESLITWAQKVTQLGYTLTNGGGDNQVVISLRKI